MDERERRDREISDQKVRNPGMNQRPGSGAYRSGTTGTSQSRRRSPAGARPAGQRPTGERAAGQRAGAGTRPSGQRPSPNSRKRGRRARRRRRIGMVLMILAVLILIGSAGGFAVWKKYGPSKEKADLEQYYGLANDNDLAVIIDNQVIRDEETAVPAGKLIDGEAYIEYSVVRKQINERFYWDPNESIMLYTLPNGNVSVTVGSSEYTELSERKSEDYTILKTEGRTAYIAVPFIQKYTNMDYSVYQNPDRVAVTSSWGDIQTAVVKRDTEVRYQGGVKSPVLTEIKKSDKVTVLEDENDWKKVATADGFIGYVKTKHLRETKKETISRDFSEPEYTNMSLNKTINMAWHNVENDVANSYVLETIAGTKGLNVIAPTWFTIADTDGNMTSIASSDYVNYAHQSNLEVWAVLRDFHGGINSYDETYEVLSYTSKRETLINQVIAAALQSGVDGINLDFELISLECGEHYIQFVRELSVKCRQNGLVFSIDNYVPQPYNEHYNLEEQGIVADYVFLMAYDEHIDGSYEAGSVASYGYVEQGISDALKEVPAEKLVVGVPFYTRLWLETPKTESELAEQAGTEAAEYPNKVSSTALGMDEAKQTVEQNGVQAEWDDTTKQNYAQWEADGGVYKIWLEDMTSLEEKLKLIKSNNLAGVAEWNLGWENSAVWDLILQYVN